MTKLCVVGLGYIGLPTASMFASRGLEVIGVDTDDDVIKAVNSGQAHFREPDLDMLMAAAVQTGRLKATSKPVEADVFILAVPTPFTDGHKPDLSYVTAAMSSIAPFVKDGNLIILESTSPVGTTEKLAEQLAKARPDLSLPAYKEPGHEGQVHLAHCPERILPGQMVRELVTNDRIIGGMSSLCAQKAEAVYGAFVMGKCFLTDCRTAEFVKLIENSYRDVNIAFANELSMICDKLEIDVWEAIQMANKHPRVQILRPGPGVGGHCIAVDPWFIVDSSPEQSRIIRMAREINLHKTHYVCERIKRLATRFRDPVIACYGLTYKSDVDDLRESPSVEIVSELAASTEARILICEPMISALPDGLAGKSNVKLVGAEVARNEADIVVFLVAHRQFKRLDPKQFLNKIVVDTVGLIADDWS